MSAMPMDSPQRPENYNGSVNEPTPLKMQYLD